MPPNGVGFPLAAFSQGLARAAVSAGERMPLGGRRTGRFFCKVISEYSTRERVGAHVIPCLASQTEKTMKWISLLGTLVGLAACVTPPLPISDRIGLQGEPDPCGARNYSQLMDQHATAAPRVLGAKEHRISTVDAVLSADVRPTRISVFFDPASQRIVGMKCG
jgi:hypothetical protein